MTNSLIKCLACEKDMGITAEKCMNCGTMNPLIKAKRDDRNRAFIILGTFFGFLLVYLFFRDYFSEYNKCMRNPNNVLLNKDLVQSMCELIRLN